MYSLDCIQLLYNECERSSVHRTIGSSRGTVHSDGDLAIKSADIHILCALIMFVSFIYIDWNKGIGKGIILLFLCDNKFEFQIVLQFDYILASADRSFQMYFRLYLLWFGILVRLWQGLAVKRQGVDGKGKTSGVQRSIFEISSLSAQVVAMLCQAR